MKKQQLIAYLDRYDDSVEIVFVTETNGEVQILLVHSFEEEVSSPGKLFINLTC
jgi:hypothetical protein